MTLRAAITIHQHCHSDQKPPPSKYHNNSTGLSVTPLALLFPTHVSSGYPGGTLGASRGDSHMGTCPVLAPQVFPFPQALHESWGTAQTPARGSALMSLWPLLVPDAGSTTSVPLPTLQHSTFVSQLLER